MNKSLIFIVSAVTAGSITANAQSVGSALAVTQNDLNGTARFMSMAGAFGALGGDLSSLSQNPAGIGVYRTSEVGISVGIDHFSSSAKAGGQDHQVGNTRFNLKNIGGVYTLKLPSQVLPNLNIGFTYNKAADFHRRYKGVIPNLGTSFSNYVAGIANSYGLTEEDVTSSDRYNPSNGATVPWLAILGYDGYLANPDVIGNQTHWYGQFGQGTSGVGLFDVSEKGTLDSYNIALGTNISNVVFLGIDFDITSLDYRMSSTYGESLNNAYVYNPDIKRVEKMNSDFDFHDLYRASGTGFNFKMGVIVKPIQELRLGFSFQTPTYYNLSETYSDNYLWFDYPFITEQEKLKGANVVYPDDNYPAGNTYSFRTPWRLTASAAGVIANRVIISADYEWSSYRTMKYGESYNDDYYYDPWYDWDYPWGDWGWGYYSKRKSNAMQGSPRASYNDHYSYVNSVMRKVTRNTNTIRIGAEVRVGAGFSVRAGYSYSSSPVSSQAKAKRVDVPGTGLMSSYTLDNETSYITCGVGYRYRGFYADLAYIYKHQSSEYLPFSPDIENPHLSPSAKLDFDKNTVALSVGYKF
ncbi:MAG: hypothetical protein K2M87_02345 [Muribaculaceae bacterium]|nr:hypothetical protein [Muribaculaceae bacterium]